MGVEIKRLRFNTNFGQIVFDVWDCAGHDMFGRLRLSYFHGMDCAIIMFDVTSGMSYKHVPNWYRDLTETAGTKVPIVLVGNKTDEKGRLVQASKIRFHREMNLQYYEQSVKSNYNYEKAFLWLARKLTNNADLVFVEAASSPGPGVAALGGFGAAGSFTPADAFSPSEESEADVI